ncbi:DEK domain-containing chromatin-associated protein 1-like [Rutidosis leptorrhynchoides]|uniref:DEK domain-containing chromatin-associated protein 1-like n=1 Tax=Rutidosis leptorrhynchoides TaxID=125765 RepID=UPI003A9983F7
MASETLEEKKADAPPPPPLQEKEVEEAGGKEVEEKEMEKEKETTEPELPQKDEVVEEEKEEDDAKEKDGDEAEENGEEETDSQKKKKKKKADESISKDLVTPSTDRPTRERKLVERYSAPSTPRSSTPKPVSIGKGRGTQLRDIPNVAFKLSKRKPDDNLQMLHTILFGKKAKVHSLKKNIGQFSGFVWVENEEKQKSKIKEKLDKCVKDKLLEFCDVLNIPVNKTSVKKDELSVKLLEFLESPHATTDVMLAEKEQKGKKRKVTPTKKSGGEASDASGKRKQTPKAQDQEKDASKEEEDDDKAGSPDAKDDMDEDHDADAALKKDSDNEETKSEEGEDEAKEKTSSKKDVKEVSGSKSKEKSASGKKGSSAKAPVKSAKNSTSSSSKRKTTDAEGTSKSKTSASKKTKVKKENPKEKTVPSKDKTSEKKQSSRSTAPKTEGRIKCCNCGKTKKKAKEPTREELHAVVVSILKEVDFNTATLSDILRQLGTHFSVDLMTRKAEVKDIITDVINNMSDEEEEDSEGAEDDNEDAGNGDKDGNDDA